MGYRFAFLIRLRLNRVPSYAERGVAHTSSIIRLFLPLVRGMVVSAVAHLRTTLC